MAFADGAYPEYAPTGCSDDMLSILARAEGIRYARIGQVMPVKPAAKRPLLEPLGNLIGGAAYGLTRLSPVTWMNRFWDGVFSKLASPDVFPFEAGSPRLEEARRLSMELLTKDGRPPALLCVLSHPPVTGKWLHLNVELTRQALLGLAAVRPEPVRARLVVAVDPFALDGFGILEESVYGGFMGRYHLGFDRLASHRRGASRWLFGGMAWRRIAHRLAASLNARGEIGIPLAGGVPTTSRALYAAREFVTALRGSAAPGEALRRLRGASPDFVEFYSSALIGERLRRSAWRMMEAWLIAVVTGAWKHEFARDGEPSVDRGEVTPAALAALEACAAACGRPAGPAVAAFEEEFRRENPYRLRLFRFLAGRVIAKGTPVVLLPLTHGSPPDDVRMQWGEPWGLTSAGRGVLEVWAPGAGGPLRRSLKVDDLAREFVRKNFL